MVKKTRAPAAELQPHPKEIMIPLGVLQDHRLTSTAKILYGVLKSFTVAKRNHYTPTLHQISMRSNIGSVVVIRTIKSLALAGYIRIHKDNGGRRNRYEILR
jgi:predicted transcriptional regulator